MELVNLLNAPELIPLHVAFVVLAGLSLIEMIGLLIAGTGVISALDSLLPDTLFPDVNLEAVDTGASIGPAEWLTGWLHLGKLPILMLLALILGGFCAFGYALQLSFHALSGAPLTAWLVVPMALVFGLFCAHWFAPTLLRLMPSEDSQAISDQDLIGLMAQVQSGTARFDLPAEIRIRDIHGQLHFARGVPETPSESFYAGDEVVITGRRDTQGILASKIYTLSKPTEDLSLDQPNAQITDPQTFSTKTTDSLTRSTK